MDPAKERIQLFKKSGTTEGLDLIYTHFPRLVPVTVFPLLALVVHFASRYDWFIASFTWAMRLHKIPMLRLGVVLKK